MAVALVLLLHGGSGAGADSPCSDPAAPATSRGACLGKSAMCMWMETDAGNLCLPCEWGGIHIPCVSAGAVFGTKKVSRCEMRCPHQELITKVSACTDVGGSVTQEDCFAKGSSAREKCMWTSYQAGATAWTSSGAERSMCGPCAVLGVGVVPPYKPGTVGPEPFSTVLKSVSQCDEPVDERGAPCDEGPLGSCGPRAPALARPPSSGSAGSLSSKVAQGNVKSLQDLGLPVDKIAPQYFVASVESPFGAAQYRAAAAAAAGAAGWPEGSVLPPDAPLIVFGGPPVGGPTLPPDLRAMYGPPPVGIPGLPALPGLGAGTAPPPEATNGAPALLLQRSTLKRRRLLRGVM